MKDLKMTLSPDCLRKNHTKTTLTQRKYVCIIVFSHLTHTLWYLL